MPSYNYVAMNEAGRRMKGTIAAENDIDLELRLQDIDLDLLDYREIKEKKAGIGSSIKSHDLIMMCLHLEQLTRAGVAIHEALMDVRDATESLKLRDVVTDLYERVKSGESLSEAMKYYPKTFSSVFIGLVKAGEVNGNLTESFSHMADHLKWANELKRKVRKAVTYPLVLLVVMSLVIAILMIFVVPKLVDFITSQGFDIPFHTEALIAVSGAFQDYWYIIFGSPVLLFIILRTIYQFSEGFSYWVDSLILQLPVIGNTTLKINMARFTHFFSVMFKSGIDIIEALDAAKEVVGNRVIRESIETVTRSVTEGNSLTGSLRISSQFPNLVIRMFKVGEDSGNMNEALENVNFFYSREVNDSVDAMVGMVQPILTAVMGLMIFWVISAVFGPLYDSFQDMNL